MSNRYLAALKENYNVVGLTSMVALSAATLNPLPILVGLVAEAAYLIFVPDSRWYAAHLSRRDDGLVEARREELKARTLPLLRVPLQQRFARLEEARRGLDNQGASDPTWLREILRKLDFLLEKFLQFALKEEQFCAYLAEARREVEETHPKLRISRADGRGREGLANGAAPESWVTQSIGIVQGAYDEDIAAIQADLNAETDASTRPILEKRLEVLRRRREFIGKIGKIVANLRHQLALLEDTFGLISDELLARPPEQVLADIEDVVSQTNTMTQVLEELAPYERMLSAVGR